jgi:MFS transporter, SP family, arabinose:H+ symporter
MGGGVFVPENAPPPAAGRLYAFFISFVAAIGGFLFGYDLVIIGGAQIFLKEQFALSPAELGFATSSAILGCIVGPALSGWLCDRVGRKSTLFVSGLLFAIGAIGAALANTITIFNIFRIVGGVGVGLSSLASPMYIAEIGPARHRGSLGLMYQLAITIGAVSATIASYFLAKYTAPTMSWRLMMGSVAIPVVVFMILLIRVPQSPRWLAERQRYDEAFAILAKIDGEEFARKEMEEIRRSLSAETGTWREFLQPGMRRALLTGVVLALLNNWTGWTGIAYYLPLLFQQAGYTQATDAIRNYIFVMTGNVFLTLIAIWLVDRAGRRPLWLTTSIAMAFCLIVASLVFQFNVTGPLVVAVIFLCAAPHAVGLGPLPWLMMSELYPTRIRARGVSISTTFLWVAGFSAPFAFPILEAYSRKLVGTNAAIFWMYAVICVISFFWGWKYLPETKGRTLEEIADSWAGERRLKGSETNSS